MIADIYVINSLFYVSADTLLEHVKMWYGNPYHIHQQDKHISLKNRITKSEIGLWGSVSSL